MFKWQVGSVMAQTGPTYTNTFHRTLPTRTSHARFSRQRSPRQKIRMASTARTGSSVGLLASQSGQARRWRQELWCHCDCVHSRSRRARRVGTGLLVHPGCTWTMPCPFASRQQISSRNPDWSLDSQTFQTIYTVQLKLSSKDKLTIASCHFSK